MAQFYQVAGTQLALPDYARADLAFQWTYYPSNSPQRSSIVTTVEGGYVEVPLAASFRFATGGIVGNRLVYVGVFDANGNTVSVITAVATQGPQVNQYYSPNAGTPYPYSPTTDASVFGIPVIVCMPEWQITISAYGAVGLDNVSGVALTVVRIPTGPSLTTNVLPVPTPLLA